MSHHSHILPQRDIFTRFPDRVKIIVCKKCTKIIKLHLVIVADFRREVTSSLGTQEISAHLQLPSKEN
jgi:hypothetical protein